MGHDWPRKGAGAEHLPDDRLDVCNGVFAHFRKGQVGGRVPAGGRAAGVGPEHRIAADKFAGVHFIGPRFQSLGMVLQRE